MKEKEIIISNSSGENLTGSPWNPKKHEIRRNDQYIIAVSTPGDEFDGDIQLAVRLVENKQEDIMRVENGVDGSFSMCWDSEKKFDDCFPLVENFLSDFNSELDTQIQELKLKQQ